MRFIDLPSDVGDQGGMRFHRRVGETIVGTAAFFIPGKILTPQFQEPLVNHRIVVDPDGPHMPMDIPVSFLLGGVADVLEITEPGNPHHPGLEKGPDEDLIIVGDVELLVVPADRFVEGSSPGADVVGRRDDMPDRLGVYVAGASRLVPPAVIFDIGIGTIPESPAVPVGVACPVRIDLGAVRIQEPRLRELRKAFYDVIQGVVGQFIVMIQLDQDIALGEAAGPVLYLPDDPRVFPGFKDLYPVILLGDAA